MEYTYYCNKISKTEDVLSTGSPRILGCGFSQIWERTDTIPQASVSFRHTNMSLIS